MQSAHGARRNVLTFAQIFLRTLSLTRCREIDFNPALPGGVAHKLSQNAYWQRDDRRTIGESNVCPWATDALTGWAWLPSRSLRRLLSTRSAECSAGGSYLCDAFDAVFVRGKADNIVPLWAAYGVSLCCP